MEFAGKDGTKGFNDFGHSSDARSYMKKFKIGELAEVLKNYSFTFYILFLYKF